MNTGLEIVNLRRRYLPDQISKESGRFLYIDDTYIHTQMFPHLLNACFAGWCDLMNPPVVDEELPGPFKHLFNAVSVKWPVSRHYLPEK